MNHQSDISQTEQNAFELKWKGRYNEVTGKAKALWADLTDDDIAKAKGNLRVFIGLVQEKTGEAVESIEQKLNS